MCRSTVPRKYNFTRPNLRGTWLWEKQTSNPQLCPTAVPPHGGISWRLMYPSEYFSYGLGTSADIVTKPNAIKTFKLSDRLGSTRPFSVENRAE